MSTVTALKPVRLIMVTAENNNKIYNMTPLGDTFKAEWGRVGAALQEAVYPISKWQSQYNSKIKKGYKDVTELVAVTAKKSEYKKIAEPKIDALFTKLLSFSRKSVEENYTVSSDVVTQAQVDEAQDMLNKLTNVANTKGVDTQSINKWLLDLYSVIPRRMKKVQDHLLPLTNKNAQNLDLLRTIIDNEQKTLDVMAGQVSMGVPTDDVTIPEKTILDALGITVELADASDEQIVKKMMGSDVREFRAVYKVVHRNSRDKYFQHVIGTTNKECALFWHGSRNENWISILQTGLKIRPSNAVLTGAMFGNGIYYADKYRKSANYTSLRNSYWAKGSSNVAYLAILDVHVGKQYKIKHHSSECYDYSAQWLAKKGGYDSVFAQGGADLINNEYIVYTEQQSTIRYLVEVGL